MLVESIRPTLFNQRKFLITWSLVLGGVSLLLVLLGPEVMKSADFYQSFNKWLGLLFPFQTRIDSSLHSWVAIAVSAFGLPMIFCFWTIWRGSQLFTGWAEKNNLALLLSYPLPRRRLLLNGLLYLTILMSIPFLGIVVGVSIGMVMVSIPLNIIQVVITLFDLFLFGIWIGYLSVWFSNLTGKMWKSILSSVGVILFSYVVYIATVFINGIRGLVWLSPLTYYLGLDPFVSTPIWFSLVLVGANGVTLFLIVQHFEKFDLILD